MMIEGMDAVVVAGEVATMIAAVAMMMAVAGVVEAAVAVTAIARRSGR